MRQKVIIAMLALVAILLARNLYTISMLQDEMRQGQIFRIIYFHVPAAAAAMTGSAVALVASILFLATKNFRYDALAVAVTEVGLAFLAVNLVTGSIWARVIWGVWWAWDPRLTSALICCILYAGYMILRQALEEPTQRATFAAVYSIFAFTDVPIVYFSIRWWRTIHPQPVFFSMPRLLFDDDGRLPLADRAFGTPHDEMLVSLAIDFDEVDAMKLKMIELPHVGGMHAERAIRYDPGIAG